MTGHTDIIIDQFTRQARPFAEAPAMRDEEALRRLIEFSGAEAADTVLDVACGPGLVVAAFAKACRHATGIDLTPAMMAKAREHAAALGVANVEFRAGDVTSLPFPDRSFSVVVSRFAFHHFADPLVVLREMVRVATRCIVVADLAASNDPARAVAFNRMEKLRDPSHTRALPLCQLRGLFANAGLPEPRVAHYEVRADLDGLLASSFPAPDDIPIIRKMFADSISDDGLGMRTRRKGEKILLSYPVAILAADIGADSTERAAEA
jgi:SAM-dependent methyltransferase